MSNQPIRVLFVCHGNICRSTMAQCVMQYLVNEAGLAGRFEIDSAATTDDEIGRPIYPPARDKLREKGVPRVAHHARRVRPDEHADWDHVIIMDEENLQHLRRRWGADNLGKVRKLMSYAGEPRDVADPWFTRDFEATYNDVLVGCQALLASLVEDR